MNQRTNSNQSEQIDLLAASLSKAQAEIVDAERNATNNYLDYQYADLTSIRQSIREPLAKNGLSIVQTFDFLDGKIALISTLLHESGQFMRGRLPLIGVTDQHSLGSATTYARRHSLSAMTGCCPRGEDDDGEASMAATRDKEAQTQAKEEEKEKPKAAKRKEVKGLMAACIEVIKSCPAAEDYLRGKGIDPGSPPPNIRDKIIELGSKGLAEKIEEARKAEEAEAIVDESETVESKEEVEA